MCFLKVWIEKKFFAAFYCTSCILALSIFFFMPCCIDSVSGQAQNQQSNTTNNQSAYLITNVTSNDILDFQLNSSKQECKSYENIYFTVSVNSTRRIENASLSLHGLLSSYGAEYLKKNNSIIVESGYNEYIIEYTMPVCSKCAGLPAGSYAVYAELFYHGQLLANNSLIINVVN